ncbi:serine/threonine protein phosphatase 1 [Roseimicrobium gellanilyticum]|uniref:Serine/threonine protein phosphatase 1 n=1 Tax=Roseimicrobium gellanilyticum TaxID=748857 RepID=A0A366H8M9_9BACT|nr:metallophosphoesterase family protein [Roseimicrobium gellanilyticum]RBP38580.1 serine/threonine protein phosphatase 1 [Roseimicrobium gellanilyticum]
MRTFAIGDIHGCLAAFEALLSIVPLSSEDALVTLGDYVDRGPDSCGVIERLMALRSTQVVQLITLRGNHEIMMLMAHRDEAIIRDWCDAGGDATIASYMGTKLAGIPDAHWDFLQKTLPYHETATHIYVHATVDPEAPMNEQQDHMLYWERYWNSGRHVSGKTLVCGHTPQRNGEPRDFGHGICIDTFAYGGQWLTCLEPATGQYWQANQKGEMREGMLGRPMTPAAVQAPLA